MAEKMNKAESRRNDLLLDVSECISKGMLKIDGITVEQAADIGNQVADHLAEPWKGQSIYIPSDRLHKNSERDEEICRRMRRGNAQDLAMEYGISYVRVYSIYRRYLDQKRPHSTKPTSDHHRREKKSTATASGGIQAHNIFSPQGGFNE